jgi:DNA-binding CsgD family transcriptional regulator
MICVNSVRRVGALLAGRKSATPLVSTLRCLTHWPYLNTELFSAETFAPEPAEGALITGLLDTAASSAIGADRLAGLGAERLAKQVGDTYLVSLLCGRSLHLIAVADCDQLAANALTGLIGSRTPAGGRPDLAPYVERFGLAAEFVAPMRAHGRVVGQIVGLRRAGSQPFTLLDLRLIGAVADVLGLGLGEVPVTAPADGAPAPDKLSRREREILALLALGHTNREIAEQVKLSVRTVEWHRARIQGKLGVTSRAALAQVARTHGVLGDPEHDREA